MQAVTILPTNTVAVISDAVERLPPLNEFHGLVLVHEQQNERHDQIERGNDLHVNRLRLR